MKQMKLLGTLALLVLTLTACSENGLAPNTQSAYTNPNLGTNPNWNLPNPNPTGINTGVNGVNGINPNLSAFQQWQMRYPNLNTGCFNNMQMYGCQVRTISQNCQVRVPRYTANDCTCIRRPCNCALEVALFESRSSSLSYSELDDVLNNESSDARPQSGYRSGDVSSIPVPATTAPNNASPNTVSPSDVSPSAPGTTSAPSNPAVANTAPNANTAPSTPNAPTPSAGLKTYRLTYTGIEGEILYHSLKVKPREDAANKRLKVKTGDNIQCSWDTGGIAGKDTYSCIVDINNDGWVYEFNAPGEEGTDEDEKKLKEGTLPYKSETLKAASESEIEILVRDPVATEIYKNLKGEVKKENIEIQDGDSEYVTEAEMKEGRSMKCYSLTRTVKPMSMCVIKMDQSKSGVGKVEDLDEKKNDTNTPSGAAPNQVNGVNDGVGSVPAVDGTGTATPSDDGK